MKVNQQPGYILHRRPYRESSLLVEVFTRHHGRLTVLSKGGRRAKSRLQGLFMPFNPVLISWTGKGELPILTSIEATGYNPQPTGTCVSCGIYVNELLLKLLHRHDAHETLFDRYQETVKSLVSGEDPLVALRIFEKHLLSEIGFGLVLDHDVETGEVIDKQKSYAYYPQKGPVLSRDNLAGSFPGTTLIALDKEIFEDDRDQIQARNLTRVLIDIQLNGKELRSRRVMREIKQYQTIN